MTVLAFEPLFLLKATYPLLTVATDVSDDDQLIDMFS